MKRRNFLGARKFVGLPKPIFPQGNFSGALITQGGSYQRMGRRSCDGDGGRVLDQRGQVCLCDGSSRFSLLVSPIRAGHFDRLGQQHQVFILFPRRDPRQNMLGFDHRLVHAWVR
jgi:hypothetical protein